MSEGGGWRKRSGKRDAATQRRPLPPVVVPTTASTAATATRGAHLPSVNVPAMAGAIAAVAQETVAPHGDSPTLLPPSGRFGAGGQRSWYHRSDAPHPTPTSSKDKNKRYDNSIHHIKKKQ